MKTRLKEFMVQFSLNAAELADKIGVQRSSISHILNGRNLPSSQFIEKLLNAYPELDAGWLITGRGGMLKSMRNTTQAETAHQLSSARKADTAGEKQILKEVSETTGKQKRIEKVLFIFSDRSFAEYFPE